jgi:predicted N-acyltransferase
MSSATDYKIDVQPRIADISSEAWDMCANPDPSRFDPFVTHAFLKALEDSGAVGGRTGWTPRHLVLRTTGTDAVIACAPCYAKTHSQGEYVFDHAWADAFARAGGDYYPKLQMAVPFTPVPGRRLLVHPTLGREDSEGLLAAGAAQLVERSNLSGAHITFLSEGEWERLGARGFLQRMDQQFHWTNAGYATFEDYLGSLASRKRKTMRKEREQAVADLSIEWRRGKEITEADWDAFFTFYMQTGSRKWGRPYLNRKFFSLLGESGVGDRCLLMLAKRGSQAIAGSFHLVGGDCLYGRYWGATEHQPFLHFEMCYYQAIDYCIQNRIARAEAGAQGEHKLARGYLPTRTYSAHYIANPSLRRAIAEYLTRERAYVEAACEELTEYAPFRKGLPPDQA